MSLPFAHSPVSTAVLLAAGLAVATSAHAQTSSEAHTLKTVTVRASSTPTLTTENTQSYTAEGASTATGLTLTLRETPQSVTVVTRERLDDQGLNSIKDVVEQTAGISSQEFDSARYGFAARGFDITNLQVDGVATAWEAGWSAGESLSGVAIYDRIEIVRGAAGLLVGVGNPSAAINMVRKRATSKVFTGQLELGLGNHQQTHGMVDLSTPLNAEGSVRARVVGALQKQDSVRQGAGEDHKEFYGTVAADLTPRTQLTVGASQQVNDPKSPSWGGIPAWYSDGSRTDFDPSTTTSADWTRYKATNKVAFAELKHRLDNDWKLRSTVQHSETGGFSKLLYIYGVVDRQTGLGLTAWPGRYATTRKQDDVDLQASGPFDAFGRRHELTMGLQHSTQKFDADGYPALSWPDVGDFRNWTGHSAEPVWGDRYDYESFKTTQTGLYAATKLSLTDPLKLILGARATEWKKSGLDYYGSAYAIKHSKVTPYAGLVYDLNDTYSAFASYTSIFNPQSERDRNGRYLDPIEGNSKEVGIKAEYLDGRLNAGLTLFQIDQDNLAQADVGQMVPGSSPPAQAYYAAQGTRSRGFELDVSGELQPGWNLSVGLSQFKAQDAANKDVNSDMPRKMLKVFTSYRLPGAWSKLVLGGGVNWVGGHYGEGLDPTGNVSRIEQAAYTLVNLMARYEISPQTSLQLNIDNATDKRYYSQVGFYSQYAWAEPRSVLLTLKHRF